MTSVAARVFCIHPSTFLQHNFWSRLIFTLNSYIEELQVIISIVRWTLSVS